jgi:hypothetical protein
VASSEPKDASGHPTAAVPDGPLSDVASIRRAEEALASTLAEVDRTEEELRAAEEVVARLRSELGGRLSEAERLTSLVAQAYEIQRQRLERELEQIQARARQLQRASEPGSVEESVPVAPPVAVAPAAEVAPAPEAPIPTPAPVAAAPEVVEAVAEAAPEPVPVPPGAANERKRGKKEAEPPPVAEGGEAYEDHWYQVLKQSGLGSEEAPSDAAAGR